MEIGVLHLGLGAFHRAHQAVYFNQAIANGHPEMAIAAVSMRKSDVADSLRDEGFSYRVAARDGASEEITTVTAIKETYFYERDLNAIEAIAVSPALKAITLTVTEKAYRTDGTSEFPSQLTHLLNERFKSGAPGVAVICCDNLPSNGDSTARMVNQVASELSDPPFLAWISNHIRFPNSMVDRIVPAITGDSITTEPFSQWVIENDPISKYLVGTGVEFVTDVRPYELAKIRLFNGVHSTLAYLGELLGVEHVADAIVDPIIGPYIKAMQEQEITPSISDPAGINLNSYAATIRKRISNPTLKHRAEQIAMDGSQKLSQRIISAMNDLSAQSSPAPRLAMALAIWVHYLANCPRVNDPFAPELIRFAQLADPLMAVTAVFEHPTFSSKISAQYLPEIAAHLADLRSRDLLDVLKELEQ
jgi:fructuronate reductase